MGTFLAVVLRQLIHVGHCQDVTGTFGGQEYRSNSKFLAAGPAINTSTCVAIPVPVVVVLVDARGTYVRSLKVDIIHF